MNDWIWKAIILTAGIFSIISAVMLYNVSDRVSLYEFGIGQRNQSIDNLGQRMDLAQGLIGQINVRFTKVEERSNDLEQRMNEIEKSMKKKTGAIPTISNIVPLDRWTITLGDK